MRYYVSTGGKPVEVDVRELPSGQLEVAVDGRQVEVDVVPLRAALSVRVDGVVVDLTVEGSPPELGAVASGHRSYVRVESERERAAAAAAGHHGGSGEGVLRSPMPGRVVKVLVAPGDEVQPGQPVVVIEAMKMENELKAKAKATVSAVHVKTGEAVEGNAKLLTFAS